MAAVRTILCRTALIPGAPLWFSKVHRYGPMGSFRRPPAALARLPVRIVIHGPGCPRPVPPASRPPAGVSNFNIDK